MSDTPIETHGGPAITIARRDPLRNNALYYNGDGTLLRFPAIGTFDAFTLEAWVHVQGTTSVQTLLANDGEAGAGVLRASAVPVIIPGAPSWQWQVELAINDAPPISFCRKLLYNRWYYLAITRTEQGVTLYVDGTRAEASAAPSRGEVPFGPGTVGIRRSGPSYADPLRGAVGQVRVWKGAVPADAIAVIGHYSLAGPVELVDPNGVPVATLAANWPAFEGYGTVVFDRTGPHDAQLGDGLDEARQPAWIVSSATDAPTFTVTDWLHPDSSKPPHTLVVESLTAWLQGKPEGSLYNRLGHRLRKTANANG